MLLLCSVVEIQQLSSQDIVKPLVDSYIFEIRTVINHVDEGGIHAAFQKPKVSVPPVPHCLFFANETTASASAAYPPAH